MHSIDPTWNLCNLMDIGSFFVENKFRKLATFLLIIKMKAHKSKGGGVGIEFKTLSHTR